MVEGGETAFKILFRQAMEQFKLTEVSEKGISQALRAVLSNPELRRIFFVIGGLPSQQLRQVESEVLKDYQQELMARLVRNHLFLARGKELQIIRRPEILLTYTYLGKIFLAVTERQLVTGEGGILVAAELGDFQYLPKPNRATPVRAICESWGADSKTVDEYLERKFLRRAHQEQVDIFLDNEFNLLRYDRHGSFIDAFPKAGPIPSISIAKGRSYTKAE